MFNIQEAKPLVSIGVPVYNGEKYLSQCLESIYQQTYQHWECFIINNKSTDGSLTIANSFEIKDSRFKVITNPEFVDINSNFNNTIKPISDSAKYFKVVCADDWIFPACIEEMVNLMDKHPAVGICSAYRIDRNEVRCQGLNINNGPEFNGKEVLKDQLLNKYDVTGSETTVLYRIDTLKKIKTFPKIYSSSNYHSDTSLAYELFNLSNLGFVFQVLTYTRRHDETYTSKNVDKFNTRLNFLEMELFNYKNSFPELKRTYSLIRAEYGVYMLKIRLLNNKECIDWHNKYLPKERQFSALECIIGLLKLSSFKIYKKLKAYH